MAAQLKPDLTVLCFFSNDFTDNGRSDYYNVNTDGSLTIKSLSESAVARKRFLKYFPIYDWLVSHSHLFGLIRHAATDIIIKLEKSKLEKTSKLVINYPETESDYLNNNNYNVTKIFLQQLKKSVLASGSGLLVFYIPGEEAVRYFKQFGQFINCEAALNSIAKSEDFTVVSLTPFLSSSGCAVRDLYYAKDMHFTKTAHCKIAGFMVPYIRQYINQEKIKHDQ